MSYPLVLDLAADGIPVTVTCRVLGFSTQAFNTWRRNPVSQRDWDEAQLINAAIDIHDDDPAFGYRFISDELADSVELADAGISASERRVWRLCSQQGIWSVFAKKKGLSKKAGPPVHDDLVGRDFTAERPNALWLTDITEHRTTWNQPVVATPHYRRRCCGFTKEAKVRNREQAVHGCREKGLLSPSGQGRNGPSCRS
jgi:putative transposase